MSDDTATIERDLAAVEAALASGTATHEDPIARELQELALELRADAPRADDEWAEQMRARVAQAFPRAPRARRRRSAFLRDFAMPFGSVAAGVAVIIGLVLIAEGSNGGHEDGSAGGGGGSVAMEGGGDDDGSVAGGGGSGGGAGESRVKSQARGGAGSGVADAVVAPDVPLAAKGFAPGQANRKIERSFSLELGVPVDEMTRVADEVTEVTNRHGGFVLSSSVNTGEDDGGGDFSLRIPADRLRPALRDLAELAPVIRQSQEGRDVTRQHVTAKDRLQAARAERRSLLRRLEEADTDEEAEAIRRSLDLVAGEINGLRAQLRDLRLRTDYAVVNVSLEVADGDSGGGGVGSFDDSIDDAGDLLVGFAGVLIRVLALAIPLALIAGAGWWAGSGLRRRRRESALA
jgi:Domain of unknown function (DUF4349)